MTSYTPTLTKSYRVASAIAGYLIVAASATDKVVEVANSATDPLLGAAGSMGAPEGGLVDVDLAGIGEVRIGGDVDFGDPLTSDANGKAVKAVPVAGSVVRIIGFAQADGADGDIAPYLIAPGVLATPAAG
ncbi:MAG: hypothetical protein KIS86_04690 [Devosia sp.]|nr:hypothetical protein [Devosia sp.]